jgi:tellurium resistance protein TerD
MDEVKCPVCGSTQVMGQEKGYGLGKAAVGWVTLGPVGLLGGLVGSKKIRLGCLSCGHRWKPISLSERKEKDMEITLRCPVSVLFFCVISGFILTFSLLHLHLTYTLTESIIFALVTSFVILAFCFRTESGDKNEKPSITQASYTPPQISYAPPSNAPLSAKFKKKIAYQPKL